jgi:hypothetical protein
MRARAAYARRKISNQAGDRLDRARTGLSIY